jgi:hypothetical protein
MMEAFRWLILWLVANNAGIHATLIPGYALDYAPLLWLYSGEKYMPYDMGQQLIHTVPEVNFQVITGVPNPLTLDNVDQLNALGGTKVYLTSKEGINANPEPAWFAGVKPNPQGKTEGAASCTIIVTDHGDGTVDVFYHYFYAYNQGNTVLGLEFGDHVGDWEHNMIRFSGGVPQALWFSQHASGEAFTYGATEKIGNRPVVYSAKGTHAVYAIPGDHDHAIPHLNLPVGFVLDHTDRGFMWDPILSAVAYRYYPDNQTFVPYDPAYSVNWLYFDGQWGDNTLPNQTSIFGQTKYSDGPNGPKFKDLNRTKICPSDPCVVMPFRTWKKERTML